MNRFQLLEGHWLNKAKEIADASIHCVVTSPPYWRLRDYKTKRQVWGGDPKCRHRWKRSAVRAKSGGKGRSTLGRGHNRNGLSDEMVDAKVDRASFSTSSSTCRCGAWRGELGQEPTPTMYIEHLVLMFREVWRVLRPDGTLWIDIGDSYFGDSPSESKPRPFREDWNPKNSGGRGGSRRSAARIDDLKPKDLVGIPWMLAFALRRDGWWLRRDNIWHKTAAMPESVQGWRWERCKVKVKPCSAPNTGGVRGVHLLEERGGWTPATHPQTRQRAEYVDCSGCRRCKPNGGLILRKGSGRPTTNHEYIFLLAKSDEYFYDSDAIAEPQSEQERERRLRELDQGLDRSYGLKSDSAEHGQVEHSAGGAVRNNRMRQELAVKGTKNKRSVWTISPEPNVEDHFAAFPSELPATCIKAGTSEHGCCAACGAPYARVVELNWIPRGDVPATYIHDDSPKPGAPGFKDGKPKFSGMAYGSFESSTIGWRQTCRCETNQTVPARVLDLFLGSGRTGVAAVRLGRDFTGCDLQGDYIPMARKNISNVAPLYLREIE